jgi:hypothetical protein
MTFQEKRSMMLTLVEQWHQSGMSQAEFARVQNMTLVKFRYWVHKHRQRENPGSEFIQLNGFSQQQGISIRYPNGVELSLPAQVPVAALKSLLNF